MADLHHGLHLTGSHEASTGHSLPGRLASRLSRAPRAGLAGRAHGGGLAMGKLWILMGENQWKPMETNHLGSHYHLDSTSFNIPYPFLSVMFRPDLCGPPSTPLQTNVIPSLKLSF